MSSPMTVFRAVLLTGALACGLPMSGVAQPADPPRTTTAAQDGFVPIDELPPEDTLPAAPLLVGAYTVAWVLILAYVWLLWRKLGAVQREIEEARRAMGATGSKA